MTQFVWHVHHERLVEPLTESFERRVAYIKAHKPVNEVKLRLRLLKRVRGKLPIKIVKAWEAHIETGRLLNKVNRALNETRRAYGKTSRPHNKTWRVYDKAQRAYDEAGWVHIETGRIYSKALKKYNKEILALHATECQNCPWNGKTILGRRKQ